jgi:hypothetical protein
MADVGFVTQLARRPMGARTAAQEVRSMLTFVNAQRGIPTVVVANVDRFALADFELEYFDAAGLLHSLGKTARASSTFGWILGPNLLAAPLNGALILRLSFVPAGAQGCTNLWLSVRQGKDKALSALNRLDPENVLPPYRACQAMNGSATHYEFAIRAQPNRSRSRFGAEVL